MLVWSTSNNPILQKLRQDVLDFEASLDNYSKFKYNLSYNETICVCVRTRACVCVVSLILSVCYCF